MSMNWPCMIKYAKSLGVNVNSFKTSRFKQFMKESKDFESASDLVGFITSYAIRNMRYKETKIELIEQLLLFRVFEKLFKQQKVKNIK